MTSPTNTPVAETRDSALDVQPEHWPGSGHSTSGIGQVWLHVPTGAAGLTGIRSHHDGGPIASRCARLLEAVTAEPLPAGQADAGRTALDVETALRALGWAVITRADAAGRLRAAGYRLGVNRAAGHVLYADDAQEVGWRPDFTGYCLEAFAAPLGATDSEAVPAR